MIYIPYSDYRQATRVLDDERLLNQCAAILDYLNEMRPGHEVLGWDVSTRCDLAALGLYSCATLRERGFFAIYEQRTQAAWLRLRPRGKLRKRVQRPEEFYLGMRELLVWEDPDRYEEVFNMRYIPFKPSVPWQK